MTYPDHITSGVRHEDNRPCHREYEINIPQAFGIDHLERDLPTGVLVSQNKRFLRFRCTVPELEEWLSDADYYSDCAGQGWDMGPGALGMQSSARATVKRVRAALDTIG